MYGYILEISKYVIVIYMALYTLICFVALRYGDVGEHASFNVLQKIIILCIHILGFAVIYVETKDLAYLFYFAMQAIVFLAVAILFQVIYPKCNKLAINNMILMLVISMIMLTRIDLDKSNRQFIIVVVSLLTVLAIPFFMQRFEFFDRLTWVYGAVGIAGLSIVLLLGAVTNGSKLTFTIGGLTFQPSEFVKIIFVFFIASLLYKADTFWKTAISAGCAALHVLLLAASRDLGSALIFFVVYVMMLFIATGKYLYLIGGFLAGSAASVLAYHMFYHVQVRFSTWQNPWSDIEGTGFQIVQSLFAIGTGGWFGMGIYQGSPKSIPFVEQDFMFSAIAEEFGVLFGILLILVCVNCFMVFMDIALKLKNQFYKLVAAGLAVTYIFQVFLTIGGGIKFIPLTGVTLPLISYGGSSILSTLIMFAIIQGLYILRIDEKKTRQGKRGKRFKKEVRDTANVEKLWQDFDDELGD